MKQNENPKLIKCNQPVNIKDIFCILWRTISLSFKSPADHDKIIMYNISQNHTELTIYEYY